MEKKLETVMTKLKESENAINEASKTTPPSVLTPAIMKKASETPKAETTSASLSEKAQKLREFVKQTNSIYCTSPGTPDARWYATPPAWSYLAQLNNVHVKTEAVWEDTDHRDRNAIAVYARGSLVDNETGGIYSTATMCATTNERWLQGKQLSAAYGLAQTRLEERLLRNKFGYQLSLAHLEPIGAEELDLDIEWYKNKYKEI